MTFKPSLLDKAICEISPQAGMRRLAAKRVLHEYRYDGAGATSKRASAPHNMSPNSFDVQRDRLQLMREAEDMERNFAPAMMLNRKVAMYSTPISYHAMTGDHGLSREVEDYLNEYAFKECDITRRYNFFKMLEFGLMGMNRGGDYGWAFMREGLEEGMSEDEALQLPLKLQAVEPDRIGGIYQNVVANDYVSGCIIGKYGQIEAFRVFHRSMTTNVYDNPVDIPANDFVHMTDPMRIDQYRGVSVLATAIQNLRDLYEMIDFVKGKAKLASALTVFTNSNGATVGNGAMDPYATNLFQGNTGGMQQDIQFGQINHLAGGTDIKFPSSNSPSNEEQQLMTLLLKFVAMSYKLPYSFALDAAALGGVSSRLESEMAKAEFGRMQGVISPHADRMKNMLLLDACAKGVFPIKDYQRIIKGRWGYRQHPQPDLGKEASAAVNLYQTGLLDPMSYWVENAQDPEDVATNMVRWHKIKTDAAASEGFEVVDVFGSGPAKPVSVSESTTESTSTDATSKQFSRKNFRESDSSINQRIESEKENVAFGEDWISDLKADIQSAGDDQDALQHLRVELDKANRYLADHQAELDFLQSRRDRRDSKKPQRDEPNAQDKAEKAIKRDDRHALTEALKLQGYPEQEAYAMAYKIIESGKFNKSRLPVEIQDKYYSSSWDESKHPRGKDGEFGPGGIDSEKKSKDNTKQKAKTKSQSKKEEEDEFMDRSLANPPSLPSHLSKAWEIGKKNAHLSETDAVMESPSWVFDYGHDTSEFYEAGRRGEKPEYVVGWRRGDIPEAGRSKNHADGNFEKGVSLAYAHNRDDNETSPITMIGVSGRKKVFVGGWAFPQSRWGSDGEIVILDSKELIPPK